MISVLIPIYNIDVVPLINELSRQLNNLDIEGEILAFDDHSSEEFRELNKSISGLPNVMYKELDRNFGRVITRELLANEAKYDWLLFLDSDSRILHAEFLKQYIGILKTGFDVYVGGRVYPAASPECNRMLHWKYGIKRESVTGNKKALHTNNFCIKKEVFRQLNFPEFLKQYGHEDTWMEIELERTGKKLFHFTNQVEHIQIETTGIFLRKTEQALHNLLLLTKVVNQKSIAKHVSLFKAYSIFRKIKLEFTVIFIYRVLRNRIAQNLHSCNPSLIFFDLYRLHRLIQISRS